MKKKLVIILGLLLIILSGNAFAWSGRADVEGSPGNFTLGIQSGYFIWQDDRGFHVWTTANDTPHVYSGVIHTDGEFNHVRGHRLENGDSFQVSESEDHRWFWEGSGRHHFANNGRLVNLDTDKLRFSFQTNSGADGINFNIKSANYIDFDLFVDGKPVARQDIHIGNVGWHPQSNKFRLYN
ncbi:MAG: hypothetical protein LLG02_09595 [Pelosinus sp.]|nr:hypothetical protein [Pelosinus sp.]